MASPREVDDARVRSHAWPLDSAALVVSSEAVWRSQEVLSLSEVVVGLARRAEELARECCRLVVEAEA